MAPSRRQLVNLMVYLCCIHTAVFEGLIEQCRRGYDKHIQENGKNRLTGKCKTTTSSSSAPASIRRLFTLERFSQKYNRMLITYYVFFLVKTLLVNLIAIKPLANSPLGLLDCFIMPRARTFGRAHKLGPPIMSLFHFMFLIYRCFLKRRTRQFKFQVLEFLLHDHDQVLANELNNQVDQEHHRRSLAFQAFQEKGRHLVHTNNYLTLMDDQSSESNRPSSQHERLQFVQNSFKFHDLYKVLRKGGSCTPGKRESQRVEWILRPNRTSKSWQLLANFTLILFALAIYTLITSLVFVLITSVAHSMTTMGFEITYPVCARWLQRVQSVEFGELMESMRSNRLPVEMTLNATSVLINSGNQQIVQPIKYSYILMALNRTLACDLPIERAPIIVTFADSSLVSFASWYGSIRTLLDITFTFVFLIDFSLYFSATAYLLFITSYDIILNARSISTQLAQLNKELLQKRHCESYTSTPLYDRTLLQHKLEPRPAETHRHAHLARQTMAVQSILMDHFKLVLDYNQFTSYYLFLLHVSLFLLFASLAISVFTLRNVAIELEFVIIELTSVMFVIYLLAGATYVHQVNSRIHTQLSTAMALDETSAESKLRWITLIKYYSPNPLYCFNLFNKIEISHLFCLKVSVLCIR